MPTGSNPYESPTPSGRPVFVHQMPEYLERTFWPFACGYALIGALAAVVYTAIASLETGLMVFAAFEGAVMIGTTAIVASVQSLATASWVHFRQRRRTPRQISRRLAARLGFITALISVCLMFVAESATSKDTPDFAFVTMVCLFCSSTVMPAEALIRFAVPIRFELDSNGEGPSDST